LTEETVAKIFNIFVARSGGLFADDDILLWLRETVGFVLNRVDAGEMCDRDLFIAQL
jgi:hypothetical protein